MKSHSRFIGLVPARANSDGVPGKNWRIHNGKSLTDVALESATQILSSVVLSTDHPDGRHIASRYGARYHMRSSAAANSAATANAVVREVLDDNTLNLDWESDDFIVYLQPTSPFRTAGHIKEAIDSISLHEADSCVSVVKTDPRIWKTLHTDDRGLLQSFGKPDLSTSNRQNLADLFQPNGAIYIFRISLFLENNTVPVGGSIPYLMDRSCSLDIDDWDDWLAYTDGTRASGGLGP